MGSLASKLGNALSSLKSSPSRIALIGLDAAGKTTILYKLKLDETVPSLPTIGFNVETITLAKGLTFTVWDMGGQERMRPLWKMYLRGTNGLLYVVDSADRERLPEARDELARVLDSPEMRGVPVVVIANKQDLRDALPANIIAKELQLDQKNGRNWRIHGTCAKTGEGLVEAMESLAKLVKEFKDKRK